MRMRGAVLILLAWSVTSCQTPPPASFAALRAKMHPGQIAHVTGYVVGDYVCPPCPPGAQCKPCVRPSAVFVAATPGRRTIAVQAPPADVIAIATDNPERFRRGMGYAFEIEITDAPADMRLLHSEPLRPAR